MIFDATEVTYNMYSCAISGTSREMMKMDVRDRTECQNWEMKGCNGHYEIGFLSHLRTKVVIVLLLLHKPRQKRGMNFLKIQ